VAAAIARWERGGVVGLHWRVAGRKVLGIWRFLRCAMRDAANSEARLVELGDLQY
jgi:hypothetical protein